MLKNIFQFVTVFFSLVYTLDSILYTIRLILDEYITSNDYTLGHLDLYTVRCHERVVTKSLAAVDRCNNALHTQHCTLQSI